MSFERFDPIEADAIILRSLSLMPTISTGSWDLSLAQSIVEQVHALVHLQVIPPKRGFSQTIESDQLHTPSYYDLAQGISNGIQHSDKSKINESDTTQSFQSIENLAEYISHLTHLQIFPDMSKADKAKEIQSCKVDHDIQVKDEEDISFKAQLMIEIPGLIRYAEKISISITRHYSSFSRPAYNLDHLDQIFVDHIPSFAIIGLLARERLQKQKVICSLTIFRLPLHAFPGNLDLFHISQSVFNKISESDFFTVEALADSVAKCVLQDWNSDPVLIRKIKVRIEKPEAVSCALGAGVEIIRSL